IWEKGMFTEEAPGVYSVASRFVDGKNGIVVGERGAVAVDGSNYEEEGQAMADFIRGQGFEPNRLMLTHGHGDHILGAGPLAGGDVYGHVLTPEVIRSQASRQAEKWGVSVAEAEDRLLKVNVVFKDELWLDLGNKRVWVFPTPGHSPDGVSIFVEEDRLLFAGDSVVNGIVAAIGNGHSEVLQQSLNKLMKMDIDVLVPGHGTTIHGADKIQDWLRWQAGYLSSVRAVVREGLDAGKALESVVESVDYETFIGDRLPADRNGMVQRHRATVGKIVEEQDRRGPQNPAP
ncbi:MAG: MBL fold metallo-hydrolase, partial [bacterium]|nr:MBL fold metallo-hydrolase [bacterium]